MNDRDQAVPLSIHPDPSLYVENTSAPYKRIRRVIDESDGGVLGVTGERGAGKSVLLNKLITDYSGDYLTVNLSAPISSSRETEFFLMLYRYMVQQVVERLSSRSFENPDDIEELGRREQKSLRRRMMTWLVSLYLGLSVAVGIYYGWTRQRIAIAAAQSNVIQAQHMLDLLPNAQPLSAPESGRQASKSGKTIEVTDATRTKIETDISYAKQRLNEVEQRTFPWFAERQTAVFWLATVVFTGGLMLVVSWVPLAQIMRGGRGLSIRERGLLIYAKRTALRLDYEITRKGEWGLELSPFGWLKGSNRRGNEEKSRPLTLPELTAGYIDFISKVLQVFPGKIIVCIDELDKVSDLDHVRFILREIKGALYVRGTFYILSISNDALRSFEGRLGDQRDIFESTFDDVFPVRYLDIAICKEILRQRIAKVANRRSLPSDSDTTLTLLALAAAGNARDLIRNFRECVLNSESELLPSLQEAWILLFNRRLDAIRDRAVATEGSDGLRSLFMPLLGFENRKMSDPLSDCRQCRASLRAFLEEEPEPLDKEIAKRFLRFATEIEILLQARRAVFFLTPEGWLREADQLMKAYQILAFNTSDAEAILDSRNGLFPSPQLGTIHDLATAPIFRPPE